MSKSVDLTKIKVRDWCRKGLSFNDSMPLSLLPRACERIDNKQDLITVNFSFYQEERGDIFLRLSLQVGVCIQCDRCLELTIIPWQASTTLQIDQSEQQSLSDDDAFERVTMTHIGTINMLDVIEDELLLGLPTEHQQHCPTDLISEYCD